MYYFYYSFKIPLNSNLLLFFWITLLQINAKIGSCYSYTNELITNGKNNFSPKIHWDLNWLTQDDPKLIRFIKENLLIPPTISKEGLKLQNKYKETEPWKHQGQNGEAVVIEYLLGLSKDSKIKGIFYHYNAIII